MRHAAVILTLLLTAEALASAPDEWKVKREEVFEFAAGPTVTRDGRNVVVQFQTKGYCDVTVAIEDPSTGSRQAPRIVRHLASGVLGANAPAPLAKNSKRQRIVWDGKNDAGRYVEDLRGLSVRVSLGLKPVFERSLNYSPVRMPTHRSPAPLICPAPEGVYLFQFGAGVAFLRLFSHDGRYIRTIYPFAADRIEQVKGLIQREFPQTGRRYPAKLGLNQNTLLTSASLEMGKGWPESAGGDPASVIAAAGGRIAVVRERINRLAGDGATGGLELTGPKVCFPVRMSTVHSFKGGTYNGYPRSAAFAPDGRTLYLAGYYYPNPWRLQTLHGVARVDFESDAAADIFVGSMEQKSHGTKAGEFHFAASVATDARGRVYVADYMNDRIQVFSPEAKFLKSIAAFKPITVAVHHRTGEIYVFSHWFRNDDMGLFQQQQKKLGRRASIPATMTRLGPFDQPKVRAKCALPMPAYHPADFFNREENIHVALDSWADEPTIWVMAPNHPRHNDWRPNAPVLLVERDGKLVVKRDLTDDVRKAVARIVPPRHGRVRVYANPGDGMLYLGESHTVNAKSFATLVRVDPAGLEKPRVVNLPFHSEDLAFDIDGRAYLRTEDLVVRYDPKTWREVPFDYGEQRARVGYSPHASGRFARVTSALVLPSVKPGYWIMGGLAVGPNGNLAVACHNPGAAEARTGEPTLGKVQRYKPRIYAGRPIGWEVHVFDPHGKLLFADAIPGSRQFFGLGIDRDNFIYGLTPGRRMIDKRPYPNDVSCTVFKAKAGEARFLAGGWGVPVPMEEAGRPDSPAMIEHGHYGGPAWIENARWLYGGAGNAAKYIGRAGGGCWCQYAQMTLDDFGRTFVPEPDLYAVAVLDTAGNLVLRIGRYGNADSAGPDSRVPLGGDEVAFFDPQHPAVLTDRRLFVSDIGNARVVSIRLGYHASGTVALRDAIGP